MFSQETSLSHLASDGQNPLPQLENLPALGLIQDCLIFLHTELQIKLNLSHANQKNWKDPKMSNKKEQSKQNKRKNYI